MVTNTVKATIAAMMLATTLGACGKKAEAPVKTAEQVKAEQDTAAKAARESVVFGEQMKALDKAKEAAAAAEAAAKKTDEALKEAEKQK